MLRARRTLAPGDVCCLRSFGIGSPLTSLATKLNNLTWSTTFVCVRYVSAPSTCVARTHGDRLSRRNGRRMDTSLRRWTQDRGHDNGAAQIADGPEPLHDCVTGYGLTGPGVGLER